MFKSAVDLHREDVHYRIYIVPQGSFNQVRLDDTMAILTSFYGTNAVKVLPSLPMPESIPKQGTFNYMCTPLFESIWKSLVVPDDALHLVIINELNMDHCGLLCAGQMENYVNPLVLTPVIISFMPFTAGNRPEKDRIRDFAWKIISSFRYIYAKESPVSQKERVRKTGYGIDRENCTSWTCIFQTGLWWEEASQNLRLTMCSKCQREFLEADFEKIHNDLIGYLKTMSVKIVKPEEIPSLVTAKKDESGKR